MEYKAPGVAHINNSEVGRDTIMIGCRNAKNYMKNNPGTTYQDFVALMGAPFAVVKRKDGTERLRNGLDTF